MPQEDLRGIFYSGVLAILTAVYSARAFTWWTSPTAGRIAGVDWVAGWMSTQIVASLWAATALVCAIGAVATAKRCRKYRNLSIGVGIVAVVIPMLIAGYFFGSTVLWYWDPSPGDPMPGETPKWHDYYGSPTGWVTGVEYLAWAAVAAWSLMIYTGVVTMIKRAWRAFRASLNHREANDG